MAGCDCHIIAIDLMSFSDLFSRDMRSLISPYYRAIAPLYTSAAHRAFIVYRRRTASRRF